MSLAETLLNTHPEKFGLWPSVLRLLLLRVRIWWNGIRRAKTRRKIGAGVLVLVAIAVIVGIYIFSRWLLSVISGPEAAQYVDATELLAALPVLVLSAGFMVTIFTNFGVLLQSLYLSRDMDFLVTSPLPMRAVFLSKLLEAILPNFALYCAIALPVLFGLGSAGNFLWIYYPLVVAALTLLALAAGGLAAILVMAVVRVVPAKRAAEIVGVIGALVSVLCGQTGNIMNAMNLSEQDYTSGLNMLSRLNTPFSPLSWAGQGLTAIGRAEWWPGLPLTLLSLGLAAGIFGGALWLAERLYYTGWASMQGSPRKKRPAQKKMDGAAAETSAAPAAVEETRRVNPLLALLPTPVRAILVKDFHLLRRDPRNVSQLITPLIFGVVMLFSILGGERGSERDLSQLGIANLEKYSVIALAIFVGWILLLNLGTLAFTREGRSYWFLKASPIPPWQLILGKYIVSYLPAIAFCLVYLVVAYLIRQLAWDLFAFSAVVVALSMAGANGIGIAFGIAGANLEWDSPQRARLTGSSGCLVSIAVSAFLFLELVLFLLPAGLWQFLTGSAPWYAYGLGLLLGTIGAALGVIIPLWIAFPKLARIGESG